MENEQTSRVAKLWLGDDGIVRIIVGTPVSRVLGNFYLGLSNPHLPSRLFSSGDEALEWLKGYLE